MPPLRSVNGDDRPARAPEARRSAPGTHATRRSRGSAATRTSTATSSRGLVQARSAAGLSFDQAGEARHYRGHCSRGSQQTVAKAALRCVSDVQFDPCFAPPRTGTIAARSSPARGPVGRASVASSSPGARSRRRRYAASGSAASRASSRSSRSLRRSSPETVVGKRGRRGSRRTTVTVGSQPR